ncbi:MAG: alkaline phosphatase family protein [Verrucomicrobiota bacterium]|nr:alkaline phosphatase family protein [Verrucomicrobiota bacterium]
MTKILMPPVQNAYRLSVERPLVIGSVFMFIRSMLVFLVGFIGNSTLQAQDAVKPHVLVIGIDGLRPDAMQKANTPNIDALIQNGTVSFQCQILGERYRKNDTVTAPGWSSILTGVWADKHGVQDNSFKGKQFDTYPHFFARIKSQFPLLKTASFLDLPRTNEYIVAHADFQYGYLESVPARSRAGKDARIATEASKLIAAKDYQAVFVYFGNCDGVGHKNGFHPSVSQYRDVIHQTDSYIGKLLSAIKSRPNPEDENWLILLTADHGGNGKGHSRGQKVPEILNVPFIVSGGEAKRGALGDKIYIVDIATTALTHLGVTVMPDWKLDGKAVGLK